jgi:SAM-dependent methyltransferase
MQEGPRSAYGETRKLTRKKYLHIDSDVRILTGDAAKRAREHKNDQEFLDPAGGGVLNVTEKRWITAQTAERKHWMELGIHSDDDRNKEHAAGFGGYRALAGKTFGSAIELGCGPFTNLRLIANHCRIDAYTLLDPLISDYLTHPSCAYTRFELFVDRYRSQLVPARLRTAIRRRLPSTLLRRIRDNRNRWGIGRAIPIKNLIAAPIEQMPTDCAHDLVVIINVIEHCYDVRQVFANILAVMPPGSVLVFHDKLYDHEHVEQQITTSYDAAHPLRIDQKVVRSFLDSNFESLYTNVMPAPPILTGDKYSSGMLYIIGVRKQVC